MRDKVRDVTKPITDEIKGGDNEFDVKIQNLCDRTINVAAHYNTGGDSWKTSYGYWTVKAGQTVFTNIATRNRYIYFHAHSEDGKKSWGKDFEWKVGSDPTRRRFFQQNMGDEIVIFTQKFSCPN
eukprot:GHVU01010891.1.p1 GENE.GHVU01010891.1~~GHVU01010891.1.p1  ORF type:complete len:125 (+),score=16.75 GHVU01010891.1:439-813(+)